MLHRESVFWVEIVYFNPRMDHDEMRWY